MMNDLNEGFYVLDKFYTDSKFKKDLKTGWDKTFYPKNHPYILSLVKSTMETRDYGSLPMWNIYGDKCHGALIKFNFNKLKKFCDENGLIFKACQYLNHAEVREVVKKLNNSKSNYNTILETSCIIKHPVWIYENEWRIILKNDIMNALTKITSRGVILYEELKLPLDFIEQIILGPLCNSSTTLNSIKILIQQLNNKFSTTEIKFTQSKIKITN